MFVRFWILNSNNSVGQYISIHNSSRDTKYNEYGRCDISPTSSNKNVFKQKSVLDKKTLFDYTRTRSSNVTQL